MSNPGILSQFAQILPPKHMHICCNMLYRIGTMGPNKLQRLEDVLGRQGRQEHRGHRADWVDRADMVNSFKT